MDLPTAKPAQKRRRQRSPSPPAPRKKSCEACRKAKARCNTALPSCSRCQRKGIPCDYGGTRNEERPGQTDGNDFEADNGPIGSLTISAADFDVVNLMLEDPNGPFTLQPFNPAQILVHPGGDPATKGGPAINIASGQPQFGISQDDSPNSSGHSGNSSSVENGVGHDYGTSDSSQSPEAYQSQPGWMDPDLSQRVEAPAPKSSDPESGTRALPFHMITTYRDDGSKQIEIYPNENGEDYNPRFFGFNNSWNATSSLSSNRVIGAFKLWPKRMVRGDDLPPYIHPHFPGMRVSPIAALTRKPLGRQYFGQPPKLPEALANCSSICTMFYNKTPENAAFVWKNIKREQERIYSSYKSWDARDCLSAYQAMLIYSFLRMIDGETEHNNFDMAFILTLGEVSAGLWSNQVRSCQERVYEPEDITWQDWMLAESACRTGIVFMFTFIMLGLYKVIPPTQGCRGLDGMPLPCGRKLWNARDQDEFEREYRAYRSARKSNRPMTFGDLSSMRSGVDANLTPENRADIESWAADLDEFGNLVLIGGLAGPGSQLDDYRRNYIIYDENVA